MMKGPAHFIFGFVLGMAWMLAVVVVTSKLGLKP